MPPWFTIVGNTITVFLRISADTDSRLKSPIPGTGAIVSALLNDVASRWQSILASATPALTLSLVFSFDSTTDAGVIPLTSTPVPFNSNPNILISRATSSGTPFILLVGRGKNALWWSRTSCISYVNTPTASGYIYEENTPPTTPSFSHELGHILGLADRYYNAVFWIENKQLTLTPSQIRSRQYFDANEADDVKADDLRKPEDLPALPTQAELKPMNGAQKAIRWKKYYDDLARPLFARRAFVPMVGDGSETDYNPSVNLMSTGEAALTLNQIAIIRSGNSEVTPNRRNWVVVLGGRQRVDKPPSQVDTNADGIPDFTVDTDGDGVPNFAVRPRLGWPLSTPLPNTPLVTIDLVARIKPKGDNYDVPSPINLTPLNPTPVNDPLTNNSPWLFCFPAWQGPTPTGTTLFSAATPPLGIPPSTINPVFAYACTSAQGDARGPSTDNHSAQLLANARGHDGYFMFTSGRVTYTSMKAYSPNRMCFSRQILSDLLAGMG